MSIAHRHLVLAGLLTVAGAGSALFAQRAAAPPAPPTAQGGRAAAAAPAVAGKITSPKEEWGHNVGDDYFLANYQQLIAYWHKLEKESNRVHIVEIGKTAENRPMLMAVITNVGA